MKAYRYCSRVRNIVILLVALVVSLSNCGQQSTEKDFQREVLDEHNKYRSTHNADPLTLDDKLSKNATLAAEKAAENDNFDSISPGESVFVSCATFKREVSGKEVTDAWYGEVCNPDFDFANPDNEKTRGFSQLVWKDTNRIGVGRATGTNKNNEICTYIVGVYRPPGNLIGFFQENVEQGSFEKDEFCGDDDDSSSSQENFQQQQPVVNKQPGAKKHLEGNHKKHSSHKKKHSKYAKKHRKSPFKRGH